MSRLNGKVALVTGGARGLGEAIVKAFVAQGAKVVFGDILEKEGEAVAKEIGPDAVFIPFDVRDSEGWNKAVALAVERFGKLNIFVNNAGVDDSAPIEEFSIDLWNKVMDTNLTGYFRGIQATVPALKKEKGGSIINVGSTSGIRAYGRAPAYVSSYFGTRGLTKTAAIDLGKYGIRVNSVHPGFIDSLMIDPMPEDNVAGLAFPRKGEPEELANMVVFLASDESSYSTGSEFIIDGGQLLGRTDEW